MKKNTLFISILSIALIMVSCDLDRYPSDGIEASQSLLSVKDAATYDRGFYSTLRGQLYTEMYRTDVQSDLFNASLDYGNRNGELYSWTIRSDNYDVSGIWSAYYTALKDINYFIEHVSQVQPASDDEEVDLKHYVGDAYLLRAFYYHRLVMRYSKAYDPATAASDMGVPLILKYDLFQKPARNSVAEVYDQILKDIDVAKQNLADVKGTPEAVMLTLDCAKALEARVRLCMHDWSKAKTLADELIGSGTYPLISDAAAFKALWKNDTGSEIIMHAFAAQPSELGVSMPLYLGFNPQLKNYTPDFIPEQWIVDMYDNADIRKTTYLEVKPVRVQGTDYTGIYLFNKYPGNPELYTTVTNYQHKPIMFRIAEMYLISAEAAANIAGQEPASLASLNQLRVARGLVPVSGFTGNALMDQVKAERLRELIGEGTRLDDLKRWKMGFSRKPAQNNDVVIRGNVYDGLTVNADDPKFVWGLPSREITLNGNLKQNPGW